MSLTACSAPPDTLRTVATLPLPDSTAASLSIDPAGVMWISVAGSVLSAEGEPPVLRRHSIQLPCPMRWLGGTDGGPVFMGPEGLATINAEADSVVAFEAEGQAGVLDVQSRWIFRTRDQGELIAHDPRTLEPLWGWAEVGAESPALAVSPEGDRLYQSAGEMEFRDDPELLSRDLQSGRVMYRRSMPATVRALVAGPDGLHLWGAMWDGGSGDVFGVEWSNGEIETAWEASLTSLDLEAPVRVRLSPDAGLVLVVAGNETGLRILDAEAGEVVDRLRGDVRDAAFSPDGELFVLYADRVERVVGRLSARGPPYP